MAPMEARMMENSNKLWGILLIAVLCVLLGLHISLDVADRVRNLDERLESIEKSLCTVEQIAVSNSGLSVRTYQFRGRDDVCSPSRP